MQYLVGIVSMVGLVVLPLSVHAQVGDQGATSEPNVEQPVASPAPGTEVPDIDSLSQRAIEHYEIRYEVPPQEQKKYEQRRRRGLRIGVPIAVVVVVTVVVVTAIGVSWANDPL